MLDIHPLKWLPTSMNDNMKSKSALTTTILLLIAASALAKISMETTVTKDNNGSYMALMTDAHQLSDAAMQQQQQRQQQLPVEPFNFANLRRLHLKYKNGQSYASRRQGQQQQQQQQTLEQHELQQRQKQPRKLQWQQIIRYNNKEDRDYDHDSDGDDRGRSRDERERAMDDDKDDNGYLYYRYLYSDDNNNNKQPDGNGNPKRDDDADDYYDPPEQRNRQEDRNSFRLQLSGSNEPFRSTTSNNSTNNNNNDDDDDDTATKAIYKRLVDGNRENSLGDVEFYDDLEVDLPYGIQNAKRYSLRNLNAATRTTTFQSLCPTKRLSIPLESTAYEYRPNHYIEVTCSHHYPPTQNLHSPQNKNRICSEAGFSCVQLNRTIHLIRRSKTKLNSHFATGCWESEVRIVPSGCECMWPKHHYGDIVIYHQQQQKRHEHHSADEARMKETKDYLEQLSEEEEMY